MLRLIIQAGIVVVALLFAAVIAAACPCQFAPSADRAACLAPYSVLNTSSSSDAFQLISDKGTKDERSLPVISILLRKHDVFASNDGGIFRASLLEKKWERVKMPATMPRGGRFADQPEDAKVIFYYADKLPSITRSESGGSIYGFYISEDDGRTWRLVSQKDDYGPVFLHPNGTLYAATNAATFMDHAHIWMSKDVGISWREITGKSFGMIVSMFADPDHPGLICLVGNSIRGYVFQATNETYDWRAIVEWDWRREHQAKDQLPLYGYSTRTVIYMLNATLNNYFEFDFGRLTALPAFDLIPEKTQFVFHKDERKTIPVSLRFLPADSQISAVARLQQPAPTTIKIPDQKEGTDLWGMNILNPDGTRTAVQAQVTKMIYESRERAETLNRIKAEGKFQVYDINHEQSLTRSIDLSKLYDFTKTGTYRIQLIYDNSFLDDQSDGKWVGSFRSRIFEVLIR